ncbi:hypothetical protein [Natrinema halophilum]|uniref:DUF8147 domain-containing protein n=1 Tax=Natrinema halophilum TaxID=1699371 RepID=A0A7D5KKD5_9EURY|nr:hypothetical protein [Natrinema halophilum]QLG50299.1 hypothetical protein HYG82_16350 [Natrinema halophilum]
MNIRTHGYAVAAGIAAFLVVFVVVSELLLPYIEFSVFVGIPAGIVAGVLTAVTVLLFSRETDRTRRPLAVALGTFGVTFLGILVVAIGGFQAGVTISIGIATLLGFLAGVLAAVRSWRTVASSRDGSHR